MAQVWLKSGCNDSIAIWLTSFYCDWYKPIVVFDCSSNKNFHRIFPYSRTFSNLCFYYSKRSPSFMNVWKKDIIWNNIRVKTIYKLDHANRSYEDKSLLCLTYSINMVTFAMQALIFLATQWNINHLVRSYLVLGCCELNPIVQSLSIVNNLVHQITTVTRNIQKKNHKKPVIS